ncbi:MAG: 50S ribosomal protein L13 [Patescibacteria group bacterium]|nr:50S ribosomal protein L13 [Patescibacteria group bacterium]
MKSNQQEITLDATNQILGKLATKIADILRGKDKASFQPNIISNVKVIVINPDKIKVTGNKMSDKIYYHHTTWPGGLKSVALKDLMIKNPGEVIIHAVSGMLPKNKLRKIWLRNLIIKKNEPQNNAN